MDSKKIAIVLIILLGIIVNIVSPVYAQEYSFTFTVSPTQLTAKKGETITVNLGVADIDQSTNGIHAVQGDLSYDENLFESVEIVKSGDGWSVTLNNEENNNLRGRFLMNNMNSVKESGTIAILRAKIKSDATVTSGTINLKNVCSSYGMTETAKSDKTITVKIEEQQTPQEPDTPQEPQNPETPQGPENPTPPANNNGSSTEPKPAVQTPNKNNSTTKLPKAGLSSWIVVGIVGAILGAVVTYIRYKKIY